ncbi:MAG: cyclophilin-like fold protein [Hyphomicrobium sp.]
MTRLSRRKLFLALALPMVLSSAAQGEETNAMKIRLTVNGKTLPATLMDNATAREFLALLPMTLTLEDYASTEKISYLPRKLSTAGAPAGHDPSVGDITYYAPWGNLAIFYRDFRYSRGLIQLGRINSGIEALNVPGKLKVTIKRVEK